VLNHLARLKQDANGKCGAKMKVNGAWSLEQANSFLEQSIIPLRLAVLDQSGFPLLLSLWFLPDDGALWCATKHDAAVARYLGLNPHCGFEVAGDTPPYCGVRGQGRASLHPSEGLNVLRRLLARYSIDPSSKLSRLLLAQADREVAIRIEIDWLTSWDFRQRMKGATQQ
jgi:hypothetical protein